MKRTQPWFPGHMAKTKRELDRHFQEADLWFHAVDARAPSSTFAPELFRTRAREKLMVVFTKTDLADPKETRAWGNWFQRQGYLVFTQRRFFLSTIREKFRKNFSRNSMHAVIAGFPNVGKSTLLNFLAGRRKARTGALPGVTRGPQWIKVEAGLFLLDTPGVFLPRRLEEEKKWRLAVLGVMPENSYSDELFEICEALVRYARENCSLFSEEPENFFELLDVYGNRWKLFLKKGEINREAVARRIISEFRKGKWGRITLEKLELISKPFPCHPRECGDPKN